MFRLLFFTLLTTNPLSMGVAGPPQLGPPEAIPEVVESNISSRDSPLWVSADKAAATDGLLNPAHFAATDLDLLRQHVEGNRAARLAKGAQLDVPSDTPPRAGIECPEILGAPIVESRIPRSAKELTALVNASHRIVVGRVSRVQQGFFDGQPASLLQIQIHDVLKGKGSRAEEPLYLAYPFARFALGGEAYCLGLPGTEPPESGSLLLAFLVDDHSLDSSIDLYAPEVEELAFESPQRGLVMSDHLASQDALHGVSELSQVLTGVKSILAESESGSK